MTMKIKSGPVVTVTREERQTPCQYAPCPRVEPWADQTGPWIQGELRPINDRQSGGSSYQLYWCSWDHLAKWAAEQEESNDIHESV